MTGNCINHPAYNVSTCEIFAWCPTQVEDMPLKNNTAVLEGTKDLTIHVKNIVDFPKFKNSKRRNIRDSENASFLMYCIYDPVDFPGCPVFRIGDIVKWSGHDDYNKAALQGAIIAVVIKWDCDFDTEKAQNPCFPKYEFIKLTDPEAGLAPGWNFRYAIYYDDDVRTQYKLYGIRLSFAITGEGGKFGLEPLLKNLGTGLGLLAIEVVICDIVVLHLLRRRGFFKEKKFEEVRDDYDSSTEIEKGAEKEQ